MQYTTKRTDKQSHYINVNTLLQNIALHSLCERSLLLPHASVLLFVALFNQPYVVVDGGNDGEVPPHAKRRQYDGDFELPKRAVLLLSAVLSARRQRRLLSHCAIKLIIDS